jgi:CheY-like chemotaxis protein
MQGDGITILCVDDEETPRIVRALMLRSRGYKVIAAASAAEALKALEHGAIDLILSDQMMPVMSGTELTKLVKATRPRMPVILISGMNEVPADAQDADAFISKIGGPELLFTTIREVLISYGLIDGTGL